jgi:hypothetical protein
VAALRFHEKDPAQSQEEAFDSKMSLILPAIETVALPWLDRLSTLQGIRVQVEEWKGLGKLYVRYVTRDDLDTFLAK